MSDWPEWWEWELDVSNPHLRERMAERRFNETDLRDMMGRGSALKPDYEPDRWVLETTFENAPWEVVLEPDEGRARLVVVTAYEVY